MINISLVYQNYHKHTCYTNARISDSVVTNKDYADRAIELGHGIITSMEHGFQGRYIEGYELAHQCINYDDSSPYCKKCNKN